MIDEIKPTDVPIVGQGNMNLPAAKLPVYKEPNDFRTSLHWRIFRIIAEFVDGWQFWLISKDNYLFGSTRFQPGDKWYEEARSGQAFGNRRFWDCDGGGPGLCKPATKAPVRPMVYRLG